MRAEVDAASLGAELRLGWLNSLSVDLSLAQAVQGYGLTGIQPVPGQFIAQNPIKRFFFIITGKL